MRTNNKLGIFWGVNFLSLAETNRGHITKLISIPISKNSVPTIASDVPEGLKITSLLQKSFLENNLTAKRVCLSLPTDILIFRSFTIPWMQPNEIKNVVDFEATKYIPLKLEQLYFTYHAIPYTEKGQKNIRIIFVAIKKDSLDHFTGIIRHTSLAIECVEPGPVSLYRALKKQKNIIRAGTCAIVEIEKDESRIILVEKDVILFVREFQSPVEQDPALQAAKLINDIRVSFNFFARQNPQNPISSLILCSTNNLEALGHSLAEEFNLPVKNITADTILKQTDITDFGFTKAYGVAVREKTINTKNFDLLTKSQVADVAPGVFQKFLKYKVLMITAGICLTLIFLTKFTANAMTTGLTRQMAELKNKQGRFEGSQITEIEQMEQQLSQKLEKYSEFKNKGEVNFFLYKIPEILLSKTWLKNFRIEYLDVPISSADGTEKITHRPRIVLEGYVFSENPNEQFRIVNNFIIKLKNDKNFSDNFTDISRETIQQEILNNYTVTSFRIICQ